MYARLYEFARDHGLFGPLHRRLFEAYFQEQDNIGDLEVLIGLGKEVGLDGTELRQALVEHVFTGRLEETSREALRLGVTGTPTLFVGKETVVGAQPYEVFRQAAELAGARRR
ncbi:MAG: DsbA family protein [Chloroflexi bacterium]|nr:DsbA family protein [Chloroflexota bacterium]